MPRLKNLKSPKRTTPTGPRGETATCLHPKGSTPPSGLNQNAYKAKREDDKLEKAKTPNQKKSRRS